MGPVETQVGSPGYARLNFLVLNVMATGGVVVPKNLTVPAGQTVPLNVQLSSPAPAGGATITLQSGNTGILTISPATVTISPGATAPRGRPTGDRSRAWFDQHRRVFQWIHQRYGNR